MLRAATRRLRVGARHAAVRRKRRDTIHFGQAPDGQERHENQRRQHGGFNAERSDERLALCATRPRCGSGVAFDQAAAENGS